jgi:hypothetical protein
MVEASILVNRLALPASVSECSVGSEPIEYGTVSKIT